MTDRLPFKMRVRNFFGKAKKAINIDVEDIFGLIALGMIFKGLYMWKQWTAWVIVGSLLLVISAFAAKK